MFVPLSLPPSSSLQHFSYIFSLLSSISSTFVNVRYVFFPYIDFCLFLLSLSLSYPNHLCRQGQTPSLAEPKGKVAFMCARKYMYILLFHFLAPNHPSSPPSFHLPSIRRRRGPRDDASSSRFDLTLRFRRRVCVFQTWAAPNCTITHTHTHFSSHQLCFPLLCAPTMRRRGGERSCMFHE